MSSTGAPTVYFGNLRKAGWVKAPDQGVDAGSTGSIDTMGFYGGGSFSSLSAATHREYGFSWSQGQDADFQYLYNYRNGLFGTGLLYWIDPYASDYNALPVHWAAPWLSGAGWPSLIGSGNQPTNAPTVTNTVAQPINTTTYTIATPANTVPDRAMVLLIPPTMQLSLGFSGSATNGGVVRVQPINLDGTLAATQDMTLLSATASTRMNKTLSGATYSAVKVYLSSTVAGTSTVTLTSGDAIYSLIGSSPTLTGNHNEGRGSTGMRFKTDPTLTYTFFDNTGTAPRRYVSAAATFTEVGAWL